jgi:TIR domain
MADRQAFWSYVHRDDDDENGRIVHLARLLGRRLRLLTGSDFEIFVDRDGLAWGDDWGAKIGEALLDTSFFIPIVTPSYFRSESCRGELLQFSSSAQALGLEELILPIYYADVPELSDSSPSGDGLIDLVRRYQWQDWREVGLDDPNFSGHRKAVHRLAMDLLARADVADSKPSSVPGAVVGRQARDDASPLAESDNGRTDEPDNGPDLLNVLAAGEEAMPRLAERMTQMTPIIASLGEYATEATEELNQSDAHGKGFAGRLMATRRYAAKLEQPAERLEQLVAGYLDDLSVIDPSISTLLQLLREDPAQIPSASDLLDSIAALADNAETAFNSTEAMIASMQQNARWAKEIRRPSNRITKALRQLVDARLVFRRWRAQVDELRELGS